MNVDISNEPGVKRDTHEYFQGVLKRFRNYGGLDQKKPYGRYSFTVNSKLYYWMPGDILIPIEDTD